MAPRKNEVVVILEINNEEDAFPKDSFILG